MLIPLIRAAATIGLAIAPFSLGFVIIAVSEHLIRSIMAGHDPEMLHRKRRLEAQQGRIAAR